MGELAPLLPCPFCGGDKAEVDEVLHSVHLVHAGWRVGCPYCAASSFVFGTQLEAVKFWNTRCSTTVKLNDSICPQCGKDNVEGGSFEVDDGFAFQPMSCLVCETTWHNCYGFEGPQSVTTFDPSPK